MIYEILALIYCNVLGFYNGNVSLFPFVWRGQAVDESVVKSVLCWEFSDYEAWLRLWITVKIFYQLLSGIGGSQILSWTQSKRPFILACTFWQFFVGTTRVKKCFQNW